MFLSLIPTARVYPDRMLGMNATTQAEFQDSVAMPGWKNIAGHIAAAAVGFIFLVAGVFKMTQPFQVQTLFEQLLVPTWGSLPLVILLGITETLGAILVFIPKYRRWGAWLITLLLVVDRKSTRLNSSHT